MSIDRQIISGVTGTLDVIADAASELTDELGSNWEDLVDHIFYLLPFGTAYSGLRSWAGTCLFAHV